MKAIMVMFDSLNREFLPNYGCDWTKMPNFERLGEKTTTFERFYGGSMPCMPARRELHTGRYNFLHTFWTPMHPYDDSIITRLKKGGIYTHICTDHFHYWEDGGSCYLTKFDSHEIIRGQQGDPWKGQVKWPDFPDTLSKRKAGQNWRHDWVNREFLTTEDSMPQARTFRAGLDFLERNAQEDNWFLQIEAFDPHEPFYTQQSYKDLYPHDYHGKNLDWPDYGKNEYGEEATEHVRFEYGALMSMCDTYLGKVLDFMDSHDMWKDTMLIVNTDHGFMLGEKEWMGKNIQPMYEEIVHSPFFIHDPRNPQPGQRRRALAQTVDIVPTLAEYFQIDGPEFMDGKSMTPAIWEDKPIRKAALFGIFGGHVNVTDGRYVYMHGPLHADNEPLYDYTLMPCHMNAQFQIEELKNMELYEGFSFTKGAKVLKIPAKAPFNPYWYGTMLFDLEKDSQQKAPIHNPEIQRKMILLMRELMLENEAPQEQFIRLGIPMTGEISSELIKKYGERAEMEGESTGLKNKKAAKAAIIYMGTLSVRQQVEFREKLALLGSDANEKKVLELIEQEAEPSYQEALIRSIKNYL